MSMLVGIPAHNGLIHPVDTLCFRTTDNRSPVSSLTLTPIHHWFLGPVHIICIISGWSSPFGRGVVLKLAQCGCPVGFQGSRLERFSFSKFVGLCYQHIFAAWTGGHLVVGTDRVRCRTWNHSCLWLLTRTVSHQGAMNCVVAGPASTLSAPGFTWDVGLHWLGVVVVARWIFIILHDLVNKSHVSLIQGFHGTGVGGVWGNARVSFTGKPGISDVSWVYVIIRKFILIHGLHLKM